MAITAPVDGVVLRVLQEDAAVVAPGMPILEMGDPAAIEVVADVLTVLQGLLKVVEVPVQAKGRSISVTPSIGIALFPDHGDSAEALQRRGAELAALAPGRVVVKVPVNETGSQAARALIEAGAAVTFTACYEVPQVLVAAALNAAYIAPYLGRINDLGRDGEAELIAMQHCLNGCAGGTRLLVASLRDAAELGRLAAAGLNTFTISPAIAAGLFASEATATAAAAFERDAAAAG